MQPKAPTYARPAQAKPTATRSINQNPHPAVVRVIAPDQSSQSLGSGTLIHVTETHGLVLTNWHVVRDAVGPVEVVFPNGFRSGGTVIKVDQDWDLAAIGIWRPDVEPVTLSSRPPQPGESLTIAGYGSGSYRAAGGRCLQYLSPGDGHPFEIVELGAEARQGDSGGPIFNEQGQLAGVLLGAAHGRTVGSYCGRVDNFLANVMPVLDHQQKEMIAHVESNPSARVDRKLAAVSRGGQGSAPNRGPTSPDHPLGESASGQTPHETIAARSDPLSPAPGAEPLVAVAQGSFQPDTEELVVTDDSSAWDDDQAWSTNTPSASSWSPSATRPPLVASQPSIWSSPATTSRPRGAAVVAATGQQGIPIDQFVGQTPIEQAKAFLAIFGVVSMLVFLVRALRG